MAQSFNSLMNNGYMSCIRVNHVHEAFCADDGPLPWVLLPGYQLPVGGVPKAGKPDETRCVGNLITDPRTRPH